MKEYPTMNKNKSERGQSLVEFAISLLIILWLLSGAVEFGLAFFQYIQLRDAAQEGALYGSINPADAAGIETRVRNASSSPIDLINEPSVTVTVTTSGAGCVADSVTVTVQFDHVIFMPFATLFTGGNSTIPLTASVTDTILNSTC
jgi:Flp pilus assembly protein TadG